MADNYQLPMREFVRAMNINWKTAMQHVALTLMQKFREVTPVDTGRARAGWDLSTRTPSTFVPADGGNFALPQPDVSDIDGREEVWIVNNVEYVPFLEQGTSSQAPAGIMAISINETIVEMENVIAQLQ